jgi:hypothetical protein
MGRVGELRSCAHADDECRCASRQIYIEKALEPSLGV